MERENRLILEKAHELTHQGFAPKSEAVAAGQLGYSKSMPSMPGSNRRPRKWKPWSRCAAVVGGRRKPPKDLPRVRIEHELPEDAGQCGCRACLKRVSAQYDVIPPVFPGPDHVRGKCACPVCDQLGSSPPISQCDLS